MTTENANYRFKITGKTTAAMHQSIGDSIVAVIRSGEFEPFIRRWRSTLATGGMVSGSSGKSYSDFNQLWLGMAQQSAGFTSNHWFTYAAARKAGFPVKKETKSQASIIMYHQVETTTKRKPVSGVTPSPVQTFPVMTSKAVFNGDQLTGWVDPVESVVEPIAGDDISAFADSVVRDLGVRVLNMNGRAYYSPAMDFINMPCVTLFTDTATYAATLLHEASHATGHPSRLDRDMRGAVSTKTDYAKEELVAEFSAAFLCGQWGIEGDFRHAAYLNSWAQAINDDPSMFQTAIKQASRAASYITERVGIEPFALHPNG